MGTLLASRPGVPQQAHRDNLSQKQGTKQQQLRLSSVFYHGPHTVANEFLNLYIGMRIPPHTNKQVNNKQTTLILTIL